MAEAPEYFGGIDFSGGKEPLSSLWTAVGRPAGDRLEILSLRPHAYRSDLGAFVAEGWGPSVQRGDSSSIRWGVNCALGLPAAAACHLVGEDAGWETLLRWVADRPADELRDAVPAQERGPRLTDAAMAVSPFDVRSYRQTAEGMRWLFELRESAKVSVRPQAPIEGAELEIIEVAPAVTVQELGLPRRRSPGRPGESRARAAALRTFLSFTTAEQEALAVTLEDAWEAVVCCLTAWLARDDLEQADRAAADRSRLLALEGWSYRPPSAVP